jgi:hypothetical protein
MAQENNSGLSRVFIGIILILLAVGTTFLPGIIAKLKDPSTFNLNSIIKENFDLKKDIFKKNLVLDISQVKGFDKFELLVNTYYLSLFILLLSCGLFNILIAKDSSVQRIARNNIPSLKNMSEQSFTIVWNEIDKEGRDKGFIVESLLFIIILSGTGFLLSNLIIAVILSVFYAVFGYILFIHLVARRFFTINPKNKYGWHRLSIIPIILSVIFTGTGIITIFYPISIMSISYIYFFLLAIISIFAFIGSISYLRKSLALEESIHNENERTDLGVNEAKNLSMARGEMKEEHVPDFSKVMYKAKPEVEAVMKKEEPAPKPEPLPAEPPKQEEVKKESKPQDEHIMIPKNKVADLKELDKDYKNKRSIPGFDAFPENVKDNNDDGLAAANESSDD